MTSLIFDGLKEIFWRGGDGRDSAEERAKITPA